MKLGWATLANSAEAGSNGLLYIMGAGWDTAVRPSYPAPFAGALALRLLFHPRELATTHALVVELITEDGNRVVEVTHELDFREVASKWSGSPGYLSEVPIPVALNLSTLAIPSPGRYALAIFIDGIHLETLSFVFHPPGTTIPTL